MIINFSNIGPGQGGGSGSGVTPQQVEEQIQSALTPYWDSAATEDAIEESASALSTDISFISARTQTNEEVLAVAVNDINSIQDGMSAYTLTADTAALSGVVQEQQIVFSSGYNELHTQVMELSGRTEDIGFLSNRVQTNEQVLATAVNDVNDMKIRFSAYTPTTGFSTINGSAITNGGNLVIEGGGDMDKLMPISGLPVSAEVGTVVSSPSVSLGKWYSNLSGAQYTYKIKDLSGETLSSATIAEFYIPGVQNPIQINIQYRNGAWYWDDKQIVYTGEHYQIANWEEEGTTYYLQAIFPVSNDSLRFNFAGSPKKDLATMATFYDPKGGSYKLFNYNGSEWEGILSASTYTLPVATSQTLGGVKVGDYNYGQSIYIDGNGMLNLEPNRISITEVETSNQTKSVLLNWEINRDDPWFTEPGFVFNIPFFSLSASVSFKSSELVDFYGEAMEMELFGTTYAPNQGGPHLHLYYSKEQDQDPYYTFEDLEETGDMPRFDLVDGTSAFTFAVTGDDGNLYTYTANVTVANGDDVSVVITIHNDSEDKDVEVDIWSDEAEGGAPITLKGTEIALAKFGRESDPDLGEPVQKWSKYYNEDNINEVTDNLVKNEGGVSGIWKGTQAEYDTLTQSGATANPNTFYIIIPTV